MPNDQIELAFKLLLSIVYGGVIGIERESINRPAGFRTHLGLCRFSPHHASFDLHLCEYHPTLWDW
jgi:putative Mg2+ transporter-C (MgtC) family protein